jgi:osmotically-inducible protein OsmY
VTLQGRVESADDKRIAEEIAKETDGVRNVVNRLQVTSTPRAPR